VDKLLNIYQRLNLVMRDVSFVAKGDKTVNGQYTFTSHDQVTAAVRKPMVEYGIVYHLTDLVYRIDGNRTEVSCNIRFVNIDEPTDYIDVPTFGYGIDPQDKGPGKAMSYAVKYGLLKTLGLETGDDPDNDAVTPHKTDAPQEPKTFVVRKQPSWTKGN
jgi:hypothetical protein